jgi:nucleoside-diphosphate-sugar epimerase
MSLIFLTGSTGFIGSHLLTKLQSLGHEVVTDMRYLHTRKYEAVIHLASKNNIKTEFDADLIESNIILTKEIFKVPTRIIYASSCVAKYPLNQYAFSKLYAEHLGQIHGNAIGLRFHNVYGPGNSKGIVWWLMQQEDGAKITVRGEQLVRDYIDVNSTVNAIVNQINPQPIYINIDAINEVSRENNFTPQELMKLALEKNIFIGNKRYVDGERQNGVIDIGTGIGWQTMDVVNLYMKLSGKTFDISLAPSGDNEPGEMISDNVVPHISLEQGLLKMINAD